MTIYISVNKHTIIRNHKNKTNDPPYEVRSSKDDRNPARVHQAEFSGKIRFVYDPGNPLVSNAVCWVEVDEASGPDE